MATRLALMLLFFAPAVAFAQAERYELGQRLKAFEKAWDKQPDADARKRALEILPNVTTQFFSLQLGEAGRTLDEARWRLESKDAPSDATKWLTSLYANPEKRLLEAKASELKVEVKPFYKLKGEVPKGAKVSVRVGNEPAMNVPLDKLPVTVVVKLPGKGLEGDWPVTLEKSADGVQAFTSTVMVSTLVDLKDWIDETTDLLKPSGLFKGDLTQQKNGLEIATWRDRMQLFADIAGGDVWESDFSVLPMGRPAPNPVKNEASAKKEVSFVTSAVVAKKRWYNFGTILGQEEIIGNFWLSLPLAKNKTLPFRIWIPKGLEQTKPVPLVIALHGAGGTENLFFEGYGDGFAVKECEKRKWIIVAPRSTLDFTGGPPLKKLVDELTDRFPIDRKNVFIVGHSMGAMQTIASIQENPGLFKAAAALGGGGRVKDAKSVEALPIFVGIGSKDFALSGARSLVKSLKDSGAKNVTDKEYPDIEHLVIVREALPDVFKLFDAVIADKK
ncbi:hypothetical protein BH11PLA2_BH11PLA2_03270 [soil metagenome]